MAIRDKAKKLTKWITILEEKFPPNNLPNEDNLLDQFLHYLIFYANNAANAKKAFKALQNENEFGDWNEVRVATLNEINHVLDPKRIEHSSWLARIIRGFLEGVWQINNVMSLAGLGEEKVTKAKDLINQIETKAKASMLGEHEQRRGESEIASVIPPWAPNYLLTYLGLDSNVPWDPHTARVAERLKMFDTSANLVRRKKQLRALVKTDREALQLHHLLVELGKKFCHEKAPKCTKCPLKDECEFFKKEKKGGDKKAPAKSGAKKTPTGRVKKSTPSKASASKSKTTSSTRTKAASKAKSGASSSSAKAKATKERAGSAKKDA